MVEAACGLTPDVMAGAEVHQAFQSCVLAQLGEWVAVMSPGAAFMEALPALGLLVVAGIGWRIGTGF